MVIVSKATSAEAFREFLENLKLKGAVFVVKPNWNHANAFTSAEKLDWLFSFLNGSIKIIEGYSPWRNELNIQLKLQDIISPANAKMKWQWIKEQDKWFLEYSGIDKVLSKHRVEYINVTEEFWSMNTLDPDELRDIIDSKYGVLVNQEMYNFLPSKIYALRGSTIISFNSSYDLDDHIPLSTNNLFSLIPDPIRHKKWCGRNLSRFSQSVVDINKIYRGVFSPSYWINEIMGKDVFIASNNSIEADAVTAILMGYDVKKINYLSHAAKVFGDYDHKILNNIPDL